MPRLVFDSMNPGVTILPLASITVASRGTATSGPTASIRPLRIRTVPFGSSVPSPAITRAPVMAITGPVPGRRESGPVPVPVAAPRPPEVSGFCVATADAAPRPDAADGVDAGPVPLCPSMKSLSRGAAAARSNRRAPSMKTCSARAYTLNGSADQITTSAFLPTSSEPVTLSMPSARAGLSVSHRTASSRLMVIPARRPAAIAFAASWFSRCMPLGSSEWTIAHPFASLTSAMFSLMPSYASSLNPHQSAHMLAQTLFAASRSRTL